MSEHLGHCDKDADFQNCLCVEEEMEWLRATVKAADELAEACQLSRRLAYSARFNAALDSYKKLRNPFGIEIKTDSSLKPGEWRLGIRKKK